MGKKNVTWMLEDLVPAEDACPRCGERRVDCLVWIKEGEQVECQTCHRVYGPLPGRPSPRDKSEN
jgi:hypothetical protein